MALIAQNFAEACPTWHEHSWARSVPGRLNQSGPKFPRSVPVGKFRFKHAEQHTTDLHVIFTGLFVRDFGLTGTHLHWKN